MGGSAVPWEPLLRQLLQTLGGSSPATLSRPPGLSRPLHGARKISLGSPSPTLLRPTLQTSPTGPAHSQPHSPPRALLALRSTGGTFTRKVVLYCAWMQVLESL